MSASIGAMRERLVIQRNDPPSLVVSSLTRTSTTATATTSTAHGFIAGDYVTISGASPSGWNAKVKVLTVPTATTFTFSCSGSLTTPATGSVRVIYTTNAQGGQGADFWRPVANLWAELIPLSASERLQLAAVQSGTLYRFRIWATPNLSSTMRAVWSPSWPQGEASRTLAITGILPFGDGRQFQVIDTAEVPS